MDVAVSTCSLSLSIQFLLIKLSPTLCYRKVLNQGHYLLSDERIVFCLVKENSFLPFTVPSHITAAASFKPFSYGNLWYCSDMLPSVLGYILVHPSPVHFILSFLPAYSVFQAALMEPVSPESLYVANPLIQTLHRNSDWD